METETRKEEAFASSFWQSLLGFHPSVLGSASQTIGSDLPVDHKQIFGELLKVSETFLIDSVSTLAQFVEENCLLEC